MQIGLLVKNAGVAENSKGGVQALFNLIILHYIRCTTYVGSLANFSMTCSQELLIGLVINSRTPGLQKHIQTT